MLELPGAQYHHAIGHGFDALAAEDGVETSVDDLSIIGEGVLGRVP
jgi:hypothetical protein